MRPEKKSIVKLVRENISDASYVFVVDYNGMNSEQISELRKKFREFDGFSYVTKNTYLGKAAEDFEWGGNLAGLKGQSMILSGQGDVIDAAKALKKFSTDNRVANFKTGVSDGALLTEDDFDALVNLPSKPVLQSMLLGVLAAPMTSLVGVMKQKVSSLVYVLTAAAEKKEGTS